MTNIPNKLKYSTNNDNNNSNHSPGINESFNDNNNSIYDNKKYSQKIDIYVIKNNVSIKSILLNKI